MKSNLKTSATALLTLLLAGAAAQAQTQTPAPPSATDASGTTKVKTKSARASRAPQAAGPSAPGANAPLPADGAGPRPPHPGGGPGPDGKPGPGGPAGPDVPGPRGGRVQALTDFSGTLTEFTASGEDQLYDGFAFKTSAGPETVRFPRHLAQPLMAAAKAGSAVTVTGFRDTDREGRARLHLVSLTAGGQTVRDQRPARPTLPPAEEAATVRGTVRSLSQDPRGRSTGAVLSDGTVLRLPPAAAEQLAEKLKVGAAVAATGNLHHLQPGEVAARPVRVVRAETITLDGVQFLVR